MDSMKLIKKHGSPGGLPVMTVYIDADAPGEAHEVVKKYLHSIDISDRCVVTVVTEDSTPFTLETFAKWLYDNGYTYSLGKPLYKATGVYLSHDQNNTTITFYTIMGVYSSNGTTLKLQTATRTVSFDADNNNLNVAYSASVAGNVYDLYDKVDEL